MAALRTRLLVTLRYSWSFQYPLRLVEWARRLYVTPGVSDQAISTKQLHAEIVQLSKQGLVEYQHGYYAPTSLKVSEFRAIRSTRLANTQRKLAEITPLLHFCRWLPWVKGVAITGSAAVANAKSNDDVDFMIVCAPGRLWLVRPLLILFSQRYGKRRTWWGEEGNSWCFNLWTEEQTQQVKPPQRSLYTAYEVCQARWMISKDDAKTVFFAANRWVGSLLPMLFAASASQVAEFTHQSGGIGIPILSNLLDLANYFAYKMQYFYMRPHMTRERVSLHFAAFHPRETFVSIATGITRV